MSVTIDLGKFGEVFNKKIQERLPKANEAVAFVIVSEAQKSFLTFPKPPVKTGNLRRNIRAIKKEDGNWEVRSSTPLVADRKGKGAGKGGKQVEYASFIEYGTVKMAPRPFMRTGVNNALPKIGKIIENMFKF